MKKKSDIYDRVLALVERNAKAIGEMGNKWGSYTEGLAAGAVAHVLKKEFGADIIHEHPAISRGGENQEYDLVGFANGKRNEIVLAEIKSHLTEGELKKFEKKFSTFFDFYPEHRGKTLKGLLVGVQMAKGMPERVARRGFFLMRSHHNAFDLLPSPEGFEPRTLKG